MDQTRRGLSTIHHSFGETSSSAGRGQVDRIESKGASHPYESSSSIPLDNDAINLRANGKQIASGSSPSGSVAFPRDLDIGHHVEDDDDDDNSRQIIEQLEMYANACDSLCDSLTVPSQCGGSVRESGDVPGSSFDGPRSSCKRKAVETTHVGSSFVTASSEQTERVSEWGSSSAHQNDARNNSITPAQIANDEGNNNEWGHDNNPSPRFGVVDESLSTGSLRNVRLRIDASPQRDHIPERTLLSHAVIESVDASSSGSRDLSRLISPNGMSESSQATEDINIQEPSVPLSRVPYVRRNSQSRWGASSSSSASEESNTAAREDLITRDQNPSGVMDHSVSIPAVENGNSSQEPSNVNSNSENNGSNSSPANAGSSHRTVSNTNTRPYNERIELARRVLLSALSTEAEGQRDRNNRVTLPGSSSSSLQETSHSSGNSSLDQRNLDNSPELPHSLRSFFASAEGRNGLMSEQIRQIFDLMRSGDGVRFEDVMLDHSFLFNMADLNDRHRDMRMDVDDMSYEELLELGEQIGNVCTGLKEGTISSHLKQHKFAETQPKIETEPCSICREEYVEGEDIGTLDCGHDFHTDCVKQWLMLKNLCPVCKTTGLNHHK